MAQAIADGLDVVAGRATAEGPALCGTAAPFYQRHADQPIPQPLDQYDGSGEWELKPDHVEASFP